MATRTDAMKPSDLARVVIDTTVQPKAVMFPTDAKLLNRARERLVRLTKKLGVSLRQSYRRVGQLALIKHQRYAHAHQFKRANRGLRKYLGRVIRDPDCVQPTHPAQIRLKSGSSRPTELRNRTRAGMFVLAMLPANLSTAALLKGIDRNQIVLPIRLDAVAAEEDQRGRARRCAGSTVEVSARAWMCCAVPTANKLPWYSSTLEEEFIFSAPAGSDCAEAGYAGQPRRRALTTAAVSY